MQGCWVSRHRSRNMPGCMPVLRQDHVQEGRTPGSHGSWKTTGKGLFGIHVQNIVHHQRKPRWDLSQELGGRDHGEMLITGLFPMACSDSFIRALRATCPEMAPPTVGSHLPHQSSIQKISYMLTHRLTRSRPFLSGCSLFPDDPRLCQIDKRLTSTVTICCFHEQDLTLLGWALDSA